MLLLIKRQKLTLTPLSLWNYFYAGLGVFITMSLVYYTSQNLASGIISIAFGLMPIMTGIFALILLKDKFFSFNKMIDLLLGLSATLFIIVWFLSKSTIPIITMKVTLSIGYLSIFGSVIGFMSYYYYLIKHASVRVVSIVPLITPVFALLLGSSLNNEAITPNQFKWHWLVLIGLGYYEYGTKKVK